MIKSFIVKTQIYKRKVVSLHATLHGLLLSMPENLWLVEVGC